jgi:hypothetical protein
MTDVYEFSTYNFRVNKLFSVNRHLKNFEGRGNLFLCDTELYRKDGKFIQNLVSKQIGSSIFLRDGKIALGTCYHNTRFDLFDT